MLRFLLFGGSVLGLMLSPLTAQIRKFPYEGLVESEAAYVRSGPGKQYYPTGQLGRGARVTVHRHDPGGWYMIAPPPGRLTRPRVPRRAPARRRCSIPWRPPPPPHPSIATLAYARRPPRCHSTVAPPPAAKTP